MMNLMCNMNSVCIDKWAYVLRVEHKDLLQGMYITMYSNDTCIIKCYVIQLKLLSKLLEHYSQRNNLYELWPFIKTHIQRKMIFSWPAKNADQKFGARIFKFNVNTIIKCITFANVAIDKKDEEGRR